MRLRSLLSASLLLSFFPFSTSAQITTSQYDNARTGADLDETILTPTNVASKRFGKIGEFHVDGDVYAQPLYLPKLDIPGKGTHDVVFIATEGDSVYAFDASGSVREPLWKTSFTNAAAGVTAVPAETVDCPFITPQVGITSTPVIDAVSQTLYVLARTRERDTSGTQRFWQRLHALDVKTGREKFGGPVVIKASIKTGSGLFGFFESTAEFSPFRENPRAGLLLVGEQVVLTWASSCDVGPYHGWVISYDARTLRQTGVFITSPDSSEAGIWQSDTAPAADQQGNIFLLTGNGTFDANNGGRDYGDSVLKLAATKGGIALRGFFTPFNQAQLNMTDQDLGSGGPLIVPDAAGGAQHLLVAAGKGDAIYLLDRDNPGGYRPTDNKHAIQVLHDCGTGSFGAPAFWNNHLFYVCRDDVLKDYSLTNARLTLVNRSGANAPFLGSGATPVVSSDGGKNGIVWAAECDAPGSTTEVLHAYDAAEVSKELYNSNESKEDAAGAALRFLIPSVADGRVFLGGGNEVAIYGLKPEHGRHQ